MALECTSDQGGYPPNPQVIPALNRSRDPIAIIIQEVAAKYDVTGPLIMGDCRDKRVITARHEAWWRVWRERGMNYVKMGEFFMKDYSTIMKGIRKHEKREK